MALNWRLSVDEFEALDPASAPDLIAGGMRQRNRSVPTSLSPYNVTMKIASISTSKAKDGTRYLFPTGTANAVYQ